MANEELISEIQKETLRERDSKLVKVIEALDTLIASQEWSTLKEYEFEGLLESIEKRIRVETEKPEVSLPEIYRLQGEKKWAKRFANLDVLRQKYYQELTKIRKITPRD